MDYVEIRLASDDEQAVKQLAIHLQAVVPEMRFHRVKIGRDGDWLCYGEYDAAGTREPVPGRTNTNIVVDWIRTYDRDVRRLLKHRERPGNTVVALLDDAVADLRRWLSI